MNDWKFHCIFPHSVLTYIYFVFARLYVFMCMYVCIYAFVCICLYLFVYINPFFFRAKLSLTFLKQLDDMQAADLEVL